MGEENSRKPLKLCVLPLTTLSLNLCLISILWLDFLDFVKPGPLLFVELSRRGPRASLILDILRTA